MVKRTKNTAIHTQKMETPNIENAGERKPTKKSQLIKLLCAGEAVSLDTLSSALSWQRHTTSAAMTRLKQEGYNVLSEKAEGQVRTYRIDGNIPAQENDKNGPDHEAANQKPAAEAGAA